MNWRGRLGDMALFAVAIALAVLPFMPTTAWWGLQVAMYLPTPLNLIPAAGLLIVLAAYLMPEMSERIVSRLDSHLILSSLRTRLLVGTGIAALGLIFPQCTHFLGDGYTILRHLSQPTPWIFNLDSPGTSFCLRGIQVLLSQFTTDSVSLAPRILSAISCFIAVLAGLTLASRATHPTLRVLVFVTVCLTPLTVFWFGYVEHYPLVLALLICALAIVTNKQPRIFSSLSILLLIGLIYLPLLPLVAAPFIARIKPITSWLHRFPMTLVKFVIFALCLTLLLILGFQLARIGIGSVSLTVPFGIDRGSIGSIEYWIERASLFLLLSPAIISLICWQRPKMSNSMLMLVALLALIGGLAVNPLLGVPYDWDLLSLFYFPFLVLLAFEVSDQTVTSSRVMAIAAIAISSTLSFLLVNLTEAPSVARHHDLLQHRHAPKIFGWRTLEKYYDAQGDTAKAGEIAREAVDYFPEDALRAQVRLAINENRLDDASRYILELFASSPTVEDFLLRGYVANLQGRAGDAVRDLDIALDRSPGYLEAMLYRGEVYLNEFRYDSALVLLRKASAHPEYRRQALEELAYCWYKLEENDSLFTVAQVISTSYPHSPMVNIAFAEHALRTGDTAGAREYLELFRHYNRGFPEFKAVMERLGTPLGLNISSDSTVSADSVMRQAGK